MVNGILIPLLVLEAIAGRSEGRAVSGHPSQREDSAIACVRKEGLAFAMKKMRLKAITTNPIQITTNPSIKNHFIDTYSHLLLPCHSNLINYLITMLSGIRDHESSLLDAQRFYYNNYEYYNTYEDLQSDYQNDLSKIRFNLHRKSKASIVLYETHSSSYADLPHERLIRDYQPRPTPHCQHIREEHNTLDDLLYRFTLLYHEQNYSDIRMEREDRKDRLEVVILKYMYGFFQEQFEESEEENFKDLGEILERLKEIGANVRGRLELLYEKEGRAESSELLERWFAFEQYWHYLLEVKLQAQSKNDKIDNFYLFQFCQYVKYFIRQVTTGSMRSILLLAQPETPSLSQSVHPLSIPLAFTLKRSNNPPKILFLNLDGRETYLNLRVAGTFPQNVRYISVFQEPFGIDIIDSKLEKGCEEFQVDADFVNMNTAHSQLIFREIRPTDIDGTPLPYNENIILYPLNSLYLRRAFSQSQAGKPIEGRKLPILDGAVDLKWLWQEIISRQAEEWTPDLTIISYNGLLNIGEEDFKEIVRDLTALSDHRLILFTNMTGLFKPREEEMEEESGEHPMDKVELIRQFLTNYVPYRYGQVDEEKYFSNLSQFIKISSGSASLKKRIQHTPQSRFSLGSRLLYLERLASLPEYAEILRTGSQASNMQRLFKEFGKREVEENRKESEWWARKIEEVEKELLELDPESVLEENIDEEEAEEEKARKYRRREVAYRLKSLKHELQVEQLLVHGDGMDLQSQFTDYLARKKQRLLLDNLQTYHYRRAYTGQQQQRGGRLRCYRFCLSEGDGQEILLQRYSQVITDQKRTRIFVLNHRTQEEKHFILQGEITERGNYVKMKRVQFRLEESFKELDLNIQKRTEPLYVNYSHCFAKDKLYLFWPQEWDIEEEIRRRLLGLEYSPPHVNYMLRLYYNSQERVYLVEKLRWNEGQGIPPVPRRGCVGLDVGSDSRFYIFGGVYDSRLDFYVAGAAVNLATVQDDTFSIQTVPKKKDRQSNKNNVLKPKMNYRIEKSSRTSEQGGSILLSGGYGRSFTNFHSLFSYENYSVANELDGLKITRVQSKNARLTRLSQALTVASVGRFYVGSQGQGQEKFSDCVKDWVLAQGKQQRAGEREVISVLEEEMRVREFKSDHKRNYLFGWDRTIRERIYVPHCWSPELQIIAGGKLYLVYTALKTEKSNNYNIGSFLIPKEEDLVSLCLDEDRLLLLSNSPVLHSLDNRPNNYILYEGSLANMTDLVTRRELPMHERFQFRGPTRQQQSLRYKTVFTLDQRIFLLGGLSKEGNEREDYILERSKDKLRRKVRRLECAEDSLELTSPVVVKHKDGFLLYSVILEQRTVPKGDNAQSIEDYWRVKIQTFTPNESCQEETLISGPLLLYHLDFQKGRITSRRPQFQQPKMVKIIPYTRFSSSTLRDYVEKVYLKVNRLEDQKYQPYLELLRGIMKERDQGRIAAILQEHHHCGATFKNLLSMFDFLLDDQKRERENLQNEELVRDLRSLSSLLNKHMLESVLQPEGDSLFRFLIEDRSSRKVKYIAIGPLLTTRLRFLRIRFKHELSICLNESNEEELFFNTNILACEQIARERSKGASVQWQEQPTTKRIMVSYRT